MATHSSTLAWKIPWTEEPGRLRSMGSRRVGHDWATSLSLFTFMHWRQYSCLENPRDGGAWWADVSGVAQSQTQLKQLSSSSIIYLILLMRKLRPRPNPRSKNKGMVETKTSSSAMILHGATLMFFLSTTPLQIQLITASSRICVAHTERDRAHFPT